MEASKENRSECLKLIGDFRSLDYFKALEPRDLAIMAGALVKSCRDLEHARKVVDGWIEEHTKCPTPADLHRLARETSKQAAVYLPSACDLCREIPGYIRTETVLQEPSPYAGETRSYLVLCGCPRGEALKTAAMKFKRESPGPWRAPDKEDFTPIGELLP